MAELIERLGRKPTKKELDEAWKGFRDILSVQERKGNPIVTQGVGGERNRRPWMEKQIAEYGCLVDIKTESKTSEAKTLDGSYAGFQQKPAVEVIIVAMKPLSEKTYVDQALANKKGVTWLDEGRIPYESAGDKGKARWGTKNGSNPIHGGGTTNDFGKNILASPQGRFPANLLVSSFIDLDIDALSDLQNAVKSKSVI